MTEYYLAIFFITLIGLCIGSFLNVVICRAFSNESIVLPPSKCPLCSNRLKWWHNIPVLSYLFLGGKCAFCKEHISIQYPLVEIATGISFLVLFLKFGLSYNFLFMLIFYSLFIVISVTDLREKVVFDIHTNILIIIGLLYSCLGFSGLYSATSTLSINSPLIAAILGLIAGFLIMELFARLGYIFAGTRAFGEGDSFIAAGLGAIFGWKYILWILAYAVIIQVLLTLPLFFKKLANQKDYVTIFTSLIFFGGAICIKILNLKGLMPNENYWVLAGVIILAILGIYTCKRILKGLRSNQDFTYLPFGPALIGGAIIFTLIQM